MKRFTLAALCALLCAASVLASGVATETQTPVTARYSVDTVYKLVIPWTSGADSLFTRTLLTPIQGQILQAITIPDTVGIADNYDIAITDEDGTDIFGGALANRDSANTETAIPLAGSLANPNSWVTGDLTVTITGLDMALAKGKIIIYWKAR